MIKNQMTFPLAIDTTNLKSTGSVMHTATNAELMPYTIGYVPYSMIEKSAVLRKFTKGNAIAQPDTLFGYVSDFTTEATKGIPFVYTVKTTGEGSRFNEYYNGSAWVQLPIANDNSNMRLLHSFNTDYYVNQDTNFGVQLNSLTLYFRSIECVYNETGWQGTRTSVKKLPDFSASATITPTPNIALTFSTTVSSQFGTHTYTIDQTIFNSMFENGTCEIDGGTYTSGGVDYKRKLYLAIYRVGISNTSVTGNSVAYGSLCMDNVRYNGYNTDTTFFELQYGTVAQNKWLLGNVSDFMITYDASNGYYISPSETGVSIFRWSVAYYYNGALSGGYKMSDIIVTVCTLFPVYKIGGAYYVAEFDDDYVITGKLIPYAQARAWQKNINPDNNVFDYKDIPEPSPEPEDDERTSGSWRTNSDLVNFGNANGFVTQYVITGNQLQNLGHYLWAGLWDQDFLDSILVSLIQNFSFNPADILKYFVSIRKYPLDLSGNTYNLGWTSEVYIGRGKKGIKLDESTNTIGKLPNFAHNIRTEWKEIPAHFHDFRDYEPCCRVVVFVPFCGEVELTPSQAIGSEVRLEYCIDFSNGALECAVVLRPKEKPSDLYIATVLTGSMGANVQLSASNLAQWLMTPISAIRGEFQSYVQYVGTGVSLAAGAMEAGQGTSIDKGKYLGSLTSTVGGQIGEDGLSSLMGLNGLPTPKFGNTSGFSSFLVLTPNIQITYRWFEQPGNYGHAVGYACNKAVKIGDLEGKGFSVFRNVDLSGIPATQDELAAIEALLQSGVYL